jgi:hypothetical protein
MGATLLLMIAAGLLAVIASFLFHVEPSGLQILCGYAIYFVFAVALVAFNGRKQLYISTIDFIALAFMSLVVMGLILRIGGIEQAEATRNLFYFALFACTPFIIGRVFSVEAIAWFEFFLVGLLLLILVLIPLTGGISWTEGSVRPILFSSVYSTLPLSFAFGIGVLVSVWRGCAMENRAVALAYGALLMLFMAGSAQVVLRGSYYLTVLCATGLLLVMRKQKYAPLISVALVLGVGLGIGISSGSISYHERLLHPALSQLPLEAIYLDFFSAGALNIEPGRPVLAHANCLPIIESNDSAMIRVMLYLEAVKLFLSAPLRGIGVSNFSQFSCLSTYGFPHSTVLHVAAEMGLVGLGLFMSMIFKSFGILYRAALATKLPYWVFFVFVYYFCLDQLYGSYFSSSITYFMAGWASKMLAEERMINA